jgi:signal transduction histidine kinase
VLAPFWFAAEAELRPHYGIARWLGALGHQVAALLLLATVLLALAMLATARRDAFYGWFALIAGGGLLMLSNSIWPRLPLPAGLTVWLYFVGAFACVCFAPRFADAVMQEPAPRFSRLLAGCYPVAVLGAAALWWTPGPSFVERNVWPAIALRLLAAIVAPYLLWRCVRYAASHRDDRFAPWVIGWLVGATLCGGYDAALSSNLFGLWEVSTAAFGCFFLAVAFVFEIARRVDSNERRMRHSVRELEAAVAAREAELRERFAQLQVLAREQTLSTERRRLMQDMHDGVAGRLAGLLGRPAARDLDPNALLATVRESLADLRLIIDSLNQLDDDLVLAIAGLRPRLEAQLAQAGITLSWRIDPELRLPGFGPEAVLNVYRIVQEAVNNISRHSSARHAELELGCRDGRVHLAIADDGRGVGAAAAGLGTRNMTARAAQLGAELCRRDRAGGGTEVLLTFPAARSGAAGSD